MGQWQSQPVCTAAACLHASSSVLQNLAPGWEKLDPCTQFDQMVCGGFGEHNDAGTALTTNIGKRNSRILMKILESTSHEEAAGLRSTFLNARSSDVDEHNFNMLRTGYLSCMDTDTTEAAGIEPLVDLIVSFNKTWPVSPQDLKTKVTASEYDGLARAAIFLEQHNIQTLRGIVDDMHVVADPLNSNATRFVLGLPSTTFKAYSTYLTTTSMEKYAQYLGNAFLATYPKLDNKTAGALAKAVISFETDLAKTLVPHKETVNPYNVWTFVKNASLTDIKAVAPAVVMDKLVAGLSPAGHVPSDILLEDLEPSLWPNVSRVISSHPKAAVHAFMIWRAIESTSPLLSAPEFVQAVGKSPISVPRSEVCLETAGMMLSHVLDHYYISATFPPAAQQAAEKMTTTIRTQFKKRIGELGWMSPASKKRATKKVDNLAQNIGYPRSNPDMRSMESLATYYEGLNFTSDFFANMMAARRHTTAKKFDALTKPVDRNEFVGGAISMVNAFYNPFTNGIIVGAGISQMPLFHPDLPLYALYGGLGSVIGHELTHGFDNRGSAYDENAEMRSWWDNATVANYEKRTQCFVDQYSKYEVDVPGGKKNVDGELSLGENLSDAGGLRVSYEAWLEERKAMPNAWDQSLPGLDKFTHEQLFFIFYGNAWCEAATPEGNLAQLATDNHAAKRYRILGGASNSRAFRDAFKCKVREPTCEVF